MKRVLLPRTPQDPPELPGSPLDTPTGVYVPGFSAPPGRAHTVGGTWPSLPSSSIRRGPQPGLSPARNPQPGGYWPGEQGREALVSTSQALGWAHSLPPACRFHPSFQAQPLGGDLQGRWGQPGSGGRTWGGHAHPKAPGVEGGGLSWGDQGRAAPHTLPTGDPRALWSRHLPFQAGGGVGLQQLPLWGPEPVHYPPVPSVKWLI